MLPHLLSPSRKQPPPTSLGRRIRGGLAILLALALPGTPGKPASAQEPDPRIAAVESGLMKNIRVQGREIERFTVQDRMAFYNVPGVSIAVLDRGRIVWARGYGVKDVDSPDPVTVETLFQAASISKPVAAVAALRLVEEGALELDRPVNDYLTRWKIPENEFTAEKPVTLRHLLTHTGGLTVSGFPGYALSEEVPATVEVLDGSGPANTGPIRVAAVPGTAWSYSGGGYTVLQLLLEDVAGLPFPRLLRESVLDPVGMDLSSYSQPLPPERAEYAASSHLGDGSGGDGRWHIYPEMAAAGLWTNPTELARLAMELQASYHGQAGRVLSPEMTRAMFSRGMGGWGLGFQIQGEGDEVRFRHGGSNYGFRAAFMAYVEGGRGCFVMTNGDRGAGLAQEILLAVAREYGWPAPRHQEVILAQVSSEVLREMAGTYRLEDQSVDLVVEVVDDHLRATIAGSQVIEMFPTSERFFIDLEEGTRFRIDRNDSGAVVALQVLGGPRAVRVEGL